jgi:hypothetical protein
MYVPVFPFGFGKKNRQVTIVPSEKIQNIAECHIITRLFFNRSALSDSSPDKECPWPG